MTGAEAVRACEAKPGCEWREVDGGGIDISVGGHLIVCPSLTAQCFVYFKNASKKRRAVNPNLFAPSFGGETSNRSGSSNSGARSGGKGGHGSSGNGGGSGCSGGIC